MSAVAVSTRSHLEWLAERAGCLCSNELRGLSELADDGRILGVVGYDTWAPNSVSMHVALSTPYAPRRLLRAAFELAFLELGLGVVVGRVRSDNTKSLRLAESLGFEVAWRCRNGWSPGVDLIYLEMRAEKCRFIETKRKAA